MTALFVPNMDAARAVRAIGLSGYKHWVTFNLSVAAYCEQEGVPCVDLHEFLEPAEPRDNFYRLLPDFLRLLLALDDANTDRLNYRKDLPRLRWYFSLFRYLGLLEYAGLVLFDRALTRYLEARPVTHLDLCGEFEPGLAVLRHTHYRAVVVHVCDSLAVRFSALPQAPGRASRRPVSARTALRVFAGARAAEALSLLRRCRVELKNARQPKAGCTLLIEPLYEAACLPLKSESVYVWPDGSGGVPLGVSDPPARRQPGVHDALVDGDVIEAFAALPHIELYVKAMTADVRARLGLFDRALHAAQWIVRKYHVTQAVWGASPCAAEPKTLVVELLRKSGIRVFGVQHGGSYGDQPLDRIHLLSDYLFCDEFLAYGPNTLELAGVPDVGLKPAEIVPVGSLKESVRLARPPRVARGRIRADIVFPVSLAHDMSTGVPLSKGDEVLSWQELIIARLDQIAATVVIKPMKHISLNPAYAERYFPAQFAIRRVRQCLIDESCSFEESLIRYRPRLVIFEWFSTTLQEALAHDVDIVQLIDPTCRPKDAVRKQLEKRVYFAESVDHLLELVDLFVLGDLPLRRDTEYYDRNVRPAGDAVEAAASRLGWSRC